MMEVLVDWHKLYSSKPIILAKKYRCSEETLVGILLSSDVIPEDEIEKRVIFSSYSLEPNNIDLRVMRCCRCGLLLDKSTHIYGYCPYCKEYAPEGEYETWEDLMKAGDWRLTVWGRWLNIKDGRSFAELTPMRDGWASIVFSDWKALP